MSARRSFRSVNMSCRITIRANCRRNWRAFRRSSRVRAAFRGQGRKSEKLRLGVNIDHVATVRNARGGARPDPVRAALLAIEAGADGITAHLREDRRHIRDADMARIKAAISKPLNFEMAVTEEMLAIATPPDPMPAASCRKSARSAPPKAGSTCWARRRRSSRPSRS